MAPDGFEQGDTALRTLDPETALKLAVTAACLTLPIAVLVIGASLWQIGSGLEPAVWTDFNVFWAAATLALGGDPLGALDIRRLYEAMPVRPDAWYPFVYPPGFLALIAPFGALPFALAWPLFTGLSLLGLAAAFRLWTDGSGAALITAACAPVVLPALILGQTSLLWTAGLVTALWFLRRDNAIGAGILIGCLTLKPQLGLILPVALIAFGAWRVILWAMITALVLLIGPLALFGLGYVPALLDGVSGHLSTISAAGEQPGRMLAILTLLIGASIPEEAATIGQIACSIGVAAMVWVVWRPGRAPADLRDAVLFAAIPLSTPYFWHYELVIPATALLFLARGASLPGGVFGLLLFLGLWLGGSAIILIELVAPVRNFPAGWVFVPLLVALFVQSAKSAVAAPTRI